MLSWPSSWLWWSSLMVIFLLYHIKTQFMMKILARSQTTGTIDSLATRDGPSCPPMSKKAWSQLSTLGKLDGTSCQPWHNWMVPVVHLCQKWHGTSCPWYQLSYIQISYMYICFQNITVLITNEKCYKFSQSKLSNCKCFVLLHGCLHVNWHIVFSISVIYYWKSY